MSSSSLFAYAPEYAAITAPFAEIFAGQAELAVGDVDGRRERAETTFLSILAGLPDVPSISETVYEVKSHDGHLFNVVKFAGQLPPSPSAPGPAVLHIHGGGMFLGSVRAFAKSIAAKVAMSGVPFYSVDYRLAPENPHPHPVEDCYAALVWLRDNASTLGVNPTRIGVMGESAGGGLAAGVTLLARDRNFSPAIKKQILVYPMLDDRTIVVDPQLNKMATWKADDNKTGWGALLGDKAGKSEGVSAYAAPARADSLEGLPSAYIDVGGVDIFRKEDMLYAARLAEAGVPVEFHMYPGLPHGWEGMAPQLEETQQAVGRRNRAVMQI